MRGGGGGRRRPKRDDDKRRGDGEEDEDRRQRLERLNVLQQRLDDKADHIGTLPTRQWRQQVTDYLTDAGQIFDLKEELTQEDDVRKGWTVHIIDVRRVIKVTKRGGVMRVSALVVAGDGNGTASYGKARAEEMSDAVSKAFRKAKANPFYVERYFYPKPLFPGDNTIFFPAKAKVSASKVEMWPGSQFTGLRCNKTVMQIMDCFGISDINVKTRGSRNKTNMVKAVFKGLSSIRTPWEIAAARGLSYREVTYAERRAMNSPTQRNKRIRAMADERRAAERREVLTSLQSDPPTSQLPAAEVEGAAEVVPVLSRWHKSESE